VLSSVTSICVNVRDVLNLSWVCYAFTVVLRRPANRSRIYPVSMISLISSRYAYRNPSKTILSVRMRDIDRERTVLPTNASPETWPQDREKSPKFVNHVQTYLVQTYLVQSSEYL
jgi:hypothetical protein